MSILSPIQQEIWDLVSGGASISKVAQGRNVSRQAVQEVYARAKTKMNLDPVVQNAMIATNAQMVPRTIWSKTKEFSVKYEIPKEEIDPLEVIRQAFENISPLKKIKAPRQTTLGLMTCYPLFDVHMGLKSLARISGEDYDLEIATERLQRGMVTCMARTPDSERGIIINGGDFTHADDDTNQTPTNRHILDVAGRNYTIVDAAVECISSLIELALTKHIQVEYYSVPGNHDPKNWNTLMVALAQRYRNNHRVKIERSPLEFSIIQNGLVLLLITHGHRRKPEAIPLWFAAEFPDLWQQSKVRRLWTGHFHGRASQQFPGMLWEQMPPLTTRDHYSFNNFYGDHSEFQSISFDQRGEISCIKEPL